MGQMKVVFRKMIKRNISWFLHFYLIIIHFSSFNFQQIQVLDPSITISRMVFLDLIIRTILRKVFVFLFVLLCCVCQTGFPVV